MLASPRFLSRRGNKTGPSQKGLRARAEVPRFLVNRAECGVPESHVQGTMWSDIREAAVVYQSTKTFPGAPSSSIWWTILRVPFYIP